MQYNVNKGVALVEAPDEAEFYHQVGEHIRFHRERARLSQGDLAGRVNLTRTSITNIEKGRQKFLAFTLWSIARVLSVSIQDLLPSGKGVYEDALKELPYEFKRAVSLTIKEGVASQSDPDKEDPGNS